jgi:Cu(I)/Ag(I) efflux system membrane fusion protein
MSFFRRSLPAAAFFVLLATVAGAGYFLGTQSAGAGAAAGDKVYTCSMHPQVRQNGKGLCPICHMELVPLDALPQDEGPGITIDPVVVQNMGVRVASVTRGRLERAVRAFGALREAQPRQREIALKFDGFVEKLHADTEGMVIERGDPLFTLYSADLIVAQEELIAARKSGEAELVAAARQKLLLWDVPEETVDMLQEREAARRTIVWKSPAGGVLTSRMAVAGAPAMKNAALLRIVDLSVLWLDAQVPESQLALVRLGQEATATFPALPGVERTGNVIFVAPSLDETARTAAVRIELRNPELLLKPGMFARLSFRGTLAEDAVVVPVEAVLDTGTRQVAWVALGGGRFEPREVRVGPQGDGGTMQVLAGLEPGDRVVVSGQFLIDAESRLREGTRKMGHHGLMPGGRDLPLRDPLPLDEATRLRVDALLDAYLQVTRAFAQDRDDTQAWEALRVAARMLHDGAPAELHGDVHALRAALVADAPDLAARRKALIPASKALIGLFELARPGPAAGDELFVIHCPMVPADWIQVQKLVQNPYYGSEMLLCGEETRRIPLKAPGGGR